MLYVADGRDGAALDGYVDAVGEAGCEHIEMVAMDMWPAYIRSVREHTDALIAFDTFHVAQHLGAAGDQVRRQEHRALRQQGDDRLAKTRDLWLTRRGNMTQRQRRAFTPLRTSSLRVARAWAIKECAMTVALPVPGLGGRHQCRHDRPHQRTVRGHQRQDPVDQAAGLRIPQPGPVPVRHLLPSGRTRPLSGRAVRPHKFLKRHLGESRLGLPMDSIPRKGSLHETRYGSPPALGLERLTPLRG